MIKWADGQYNTTHASVGVFHLKTMWKGEDNPGHVFEIVGLARSNKRFVDHGQAQVACEKSLEGFLKDALKIIRGK